MTKSLKTLTAIAAVPLVFGACAQFQNPDAGDPVTDTLSQRPAGDVVQCLLDQAQKHHSDVKTSDIPQGKMLDFGDSNIVKVRTDNGGTTYRFYAGKRHMTNLWLESAGKTCAP